MVTTAAHRPGGKFAALSANAPAAPAAPPAPRGKFMQPPGSSQPQQPTAIEPTSSMPRVKKTRPKLQRQTALFQELDKAENLVLDLLDLASSTSRILSDMAKTNNEAEEKTTQLGKNQEEYLSKLKSIHEILIPHAHLVVAYKNHEVDIASGSTVAEDADSKQNAAGEKTNSASSNPALAKPEKTPSAGKDASATTSTTSNQADTADGEATSEPPKSCNMYAARVEMRLAQERRDVMKLFLEQEKITSAVSTGKKRDREEISSNTP